MWKWTDNIKGSRPTHITESTSYEKLYHDIQNKLNVDSSQYNMVLRYQYGQNFPYSIPPLNVTSDIDVNYMYDLNKVQQTPIFVTLVRKED